jgi:citrate lyase subunit beta/citryl-CoA lyase
MNEEQARASSGFHALPLTYLFVPGNRPDRFEKALSSQAGAVIVDLEDAVAPADKGAARTAFASWMRTSNAKRDRILLRINDESTPWFDADAALVRETAVRGVVLPKAESALQIERIAASLPDDGFVIAIVETAKSIIELDSIARATRVQRLAFGTIDYAVDLDLAEGDEGLLYPACRIALASRAAGIASPVAGVTADIGDEARLRADLRFARACGFGAKMCIHPKQVAPIHAAFVPGDDEIAWAKRVVNAADSSPGAVQVDGRMVDRPVVAKAMRILARARS